MRQHFAYFDLVCELCVILQPTLVALSAGAFFTQLPQWAVGVFALLAYVDAQILKLCTPTPGQNPAPEGSVPEAAEASSTVEDAVATAAAVASHLETGQA